MCTLLIMSNLRLHIIEKPSEYNLMCQYASSSPNKSRTMAWIAVVAWESKTKDQWIAQQKLRIL